MAGQKISFKGHSGEMLAARLDEPDGPVLATAIFAHCFTCSKDIPAARRIAQQLSAMGVAVLRFDFTGLGHSEGEFANTGFTSNVADLLAAAEYLRAQGTPPSLLIGHSLGGAAVLKAAPEIPEIKAVATLGAPHDPSHVVDNFGASIDEIRKNGEAEVCLTGRSFTIKEDFLDDVAKSEIDTALGAMKAALLVMHAPFDMTVGIENASAIFLAARHPKSFVTLDKSDHLITRAEDAEYAASVIATWAGRYLDLRQPAPPSGAPEGITRVREADPDGFLQDISAGPKHQIKADEPKSVGGTDQGMSPYQLLSAALGSCTSITVRMYARRKKWPLENISVDITHNKVHATDCETCEESTSKIDKFTRAITLTGPLDGEQRARLMQIADKCPVHKTLEASSKIETHLVEVG